MDHYAQKHQTPPRQQCYVSPSGRVGYCKRPPGRLDGHSAEGIDILMRSMGMATTRAEIRALILRNAEERARREDATLTTLAPTAKLPAGSYWSEEHGCYLSPHRPQRSERLTVRAGGGIL